MDTTNRLTKLSQKPYADISALIDKKKKGLKNESEYVEFYDERNKLGRIKIDSVKNLVTVEGQKSK